MYRAIGRLRTSESYSVAAPLAIATVYVVVYLPSVGDIALNPSLRKSKREESEKKLRDRMNSTCKLFHSMYTCIIFTMRFSA